MNILKYTALAGVLLATLGCSEVEKESTQTIAPNDRNIEESQAVVLLSGLPTLNTKDSIAIIELDPESPNFGNLIYEYALPEFDAPLHHLYYSPNGRLYATGLGAECSLAEISLVRNVSAAPTINGVNCLDTQGQQVGEDIMWHSVNDKLYMFVTFMGGTGVDQIDTGSIGVFDPQTNQVIKIINLIKYN